MGLATSCVNCGAARATFVCEKPVTAVSRRPVTLDRCDACRLVYRRGWSESFEADSYDYYSVRQDWPKDRIYKPINGRRLEQLLEELGALVSGRRLLDVGAGAGQLVSVAASLGWEARGIDLSEPAVALARRFGTRCDRIDFFSPILDSERFDVIVMSELIEHVPDPSKFLRRASALLAHDGIAYVTTPNFRSLSRHLVGVEGWSVIHSQHISYFTRSTFRRMVDQQTDLRLASIETRNIGENVIERVRALLTRSTRAKSPARSSVNGVNGAAPSGQEVPPVGPAHELRTRIEGSTSLRAAKRATNALLDVAGVGENLFAVLRKRPE